jgi:hypothetical protein
MSGSDEIKPSLEAINGGAVAEEYRGLSPIGRLDSFCQAKADSFSRAPQVSGFRRMNPPLKPISWCLAPPPTPKDTSCPAVAALRPVRTLVLWTDSGGNALVTCRSPADDAQ